MKLLRTCAVILPASLLLQACSTREGYPSIDIRDSERVSMTMATPGSDGFTPAPMPAATIENLDQLVASASSANERFAAASAKVEDSVGRAAGAAIGSEEWAVAQVEIAGLESLRSDTMLALAGIDQIFVGSVINGEEFKAAERARDGVSRLVAEQDSVIAALLVTLGS